jgi:hypothetical protein
LVPLEEGDECMLAIVKIINVWAGSTCEMKIEIALIATVEGICIAVFTASITKFLLWLYKNKGTVWVEWVLLYLGRQLSAWLMEEQIALRGGAFISRTKCWLLTTKADNVNILLATIFHFLCEDEATMPRVAEV